MPKWLWRTLVGALGSLVLIVGLLLIPYPGPGWLTVFAGLAILATEFPWARRLLHYSKRKFEQWEKWAMSQKLWIKIVLFASTSIVVIVTIWLMNGYGLINDFFHLGWDWAKSPFLK